MVKAQELRIGNFIQDKKDRDINIIQVAHIGEGIINYWMESVYQPIPLSEEWLIKFGFERQFWGGEYIKENSLFMLCKVGGDHSIHQVRYANIGMLQCFPRYVHQLQNLYFALTGEELTS